MKKIILLITSICILSFGCSRDDDGPTGGTNTPTSTDLIGTWDLDYYIVSGVLTEEIICNEQVKYVFSADNTYSVTSFSGDGTQDCLTSVIINGTWEFLGENNYSLTPNSGMSGTSLNITFQDNFSKFIYKVSNNRTEVYSKQ